MFPSTMPKSISVPHIRSENRGNRLRPEISTSSLDGNFAPVGAIGEDGPSGNGIFEEISDRKTERRVHFSDALSPAVCRICHGGEISCPFNAGEPLISSCHCSGSMGLYHRSCLEKWLSTSNTDKCEICKFQYVVERHPKSMSEFLRNPGNGMIRRNMIGDLLCLCILTPMALASCWLCVAGAVAVADTGTDAIAVPGLISLAVFLMVTYFVWLSVSLRYHFKVWRDWRDVNFSVHVLTEEETVGDFDGNNNASPRDVVQLQPLADIPSRRSTDTEAGAYDSPWPNSNGGRVSSPIDYNAFGYMNPAFVWETRM